MMQVETAVLATMVRSRRKELGLTRAQCTAAGGPSAATLAAVEQGRLTNPADTVLTQLDTGLQWPAGTAQTATLAPAAAITQSTAPATLVQHKLLYNELVARGAAQEAIDVAAAMLAPPLRARVRHKIETADTATLLAVDKLLAVRAAPAPVVSRDEPRRRPARPIPEVIGNTGRAVTLRDLRLNSGWSLDDVVAKMAALRQISHGGSTVSRGTLSAIETGQRGMSPQMASELEQVYQLAPRTLAAYASRSGRRGSKALRIVAFRNSQVAPMSSSARRNEFRPGRGVEHEQSAVGEHVVGMCQSGGHREVGQIGALHFGGATINDT